MDRQQAAEELDRLWNRHLNGPALPEYKDIRPDAIDVVCELLKSLDCAEVAAKFRAVIEAPIETE